LFSEGSSLTSTRISECVGTGSHHIEVVDPNPLCVCRFSRWTKRVHRCPRASSDPLGYLETINRLLAAGSFDVLLPTHEQAWLLAAGRTQLAPDAPIAIASPEAFSRVQSKIEFARLLGELNLPQPRWRLAERAEELADWPTPFYLKAPFSTPGRGVRRVTRPTDAQKAFEPLLAIADGGPLMVQSAADGEYAQVQALFDRERLVAEHTSHSNSRGNRSERSRESGG